MTRKDSLIPLTKTGLIPDVLEQDVECLQQLDTDETGSATLLSHDVQEVGEHVLLQEETERWIVGIKR